MKTLEYKAPGGKMIKLDIKLTGNKISYIRITGDFFIHPEKAIIEIEKILTNVKVQQVKEILQEYQKSNSIRFVGVNVKDFVDIIDMAKD